MEYQQHRGGNAAADYQPAFARSAVLAHLLLPHFTAAAIL
jgi:hypothetical protein